MWVIDELLSPKHQNVTSIEMTIVMDWLNYRVQWNISGYTTHNKPYYFLLYKYYNFLFQLLIFALGWFN